MSVRNFVVTIKESAEGRPWLLIEPTQDIGLGLRRHIVLKLPEGATLADAEQMKGVLNNLRANVHISEF